uniref:Tubulin-specific chaperone A n=1 Tax=Anas platyrhynchos platyrhynchos TaxID=8840 RepID=A0A493SZ14_ANAPP
MGTAPSRRTPPRAGGRGGGGGGGGGLQGLSAGPRPPLAVVPPRPAPRARCACARRCCAVRAPRRPRRGRRLSAAASALLGPGPRRARHGRPPPQADQDQSRRRQAVEILQESRMMIPDCQRRLEIAHADLTQLLENEKELEEAEEYKEARSILESVKLEA